MSKKILAGLILGLSITASANANLLVNGSFESNIVSAGGWTYLPASSVAGWDGSNIELWNAYGGVVAADGVNFAELNAHPAAASFSIYQQFATVAGQSYDVSFFYRARASSAEAFSISVGDLAASLTDHTTASWSFFSGSFKATSALSTITFTSLTAGTVGNFLDGVSVTASDVPVPMTLGLMGLALAALRLRRRA